MVDSETIIRFGHFKGKRLLDVPYWYLLNLYDEETIDSIVETFNVDKVHAVEIFAYIRENRSYLEHEAFLGRRLRGAHSDPWTTNG